jgi:cytoskeletal protein CcmA (bactofilin family)
MLNKKDNRRNDAAAMQMALNIIGQGTTIKGDLNSNGDIRVDGSIEGSVGSKARIVLGPGSNVEGNINAQNADISGMVTGNVIVSETLFLKATARVNGDIVTNKLVVEAGAEFNGNCIMKSNQSASNVTNRQANQEEAKSL